LFLTPGNHIIKLPAIFCLTCARIIAKEPTNRLFAAQCMTRHHLKSTGAIQHGLNELTGEDLVERYPVGEAFLHINPLFRRWLVAKAL